MGFKIAFPLEFEIGYSKNLFPRNFGKEPSPSKSNIPKIFGKEPRIPLKIMLVWFLGKIIFYCTAPHENNAPSIGRALVLKLRGSS